MILNYPSRTSSRAPLLSDQRDFMPDTRKSARFYGASPPSPDALASGRPPYPVQPTTERQAAAAVAELGAQHAPEAGGLVKAQQNWCRAHSDATQRRDGCLLHDCL